MKLKRQLTNTDTFLVGATEIPEGSHVKLVNDLLVVTGAGEAGIGFTTEIGYASKPCRVAQDGSKIPALAHDGSIAVGDWLVSAASGRVDSAAAYTSASQNIVGRAEMASGAQDQLITVVVHETVFPKAAS